MSVRLLLPSFLAAASLSACAHGGPAASSFAPKSAPAAKLDLARLFKGRPGTFVVQGPDGRIARYEPERAARRLSPCSTFKIFNALAGLDSGAIPDETFTVKWDGKPGFVDAWNKDHDLQSAVTNSVVWYFQEVARRIGEERMRGYLAAVGYGNQDMSAGLTTFWLGDSLAISADEQVSFLDRLYRDDLPFSKRAMETVRKVIVVERTADYVLSGKTGSDYRDGQWVLGWFVGRLERGDGRAWTFAVNLEGEGARGVEARALAKEILRELGGL